MAWRSLNLAHCVVVPTQLRYAFSSFSHPTTSLHQHHAFIMHQSSSPASHPSSISRPPSTMLLVSTISVCRAFSKYLCITYSSAHWSTSANDQHAGSADVTTHQGSSLNLAASSTSTDTSAVVVSETLHSRTIVSHELAAGHTAEWSLRRPQGTTVSLLGTSLQPGCISSDRDYAKPCHDGPLTFGCFKQLFTVSTFNPN